MCEKPKDEAETDPGAKKIDRRSYYYDDAHGYEEYDPSDENENEKEDDPAESA